jgi:hypothetical protein
MSLFDKEYKDSYIKHHPKPITPNSLDPRVFYFPPEGGDPILQGGIKQQILNDIDYINAAEEQYVKTRIWDYAIVGPILKEDSSVKCPINVILQINPTNLSDMLKETILNNIKAITNRYAIGTQHPIVYLPTIRKIDPENYTAMYHPYTQKWIKKPSFLGEAKTDLKELTKEPHKKFNKKYSFKRGLKKLTTV